jgi:hypothetical protein
MYDVKLYIAYACIYLIVGLLHVGLKELETTSFASANSRLNKMGDVFVISYDFLKVAY